MRIGSLFSGIGGLELGLERAGLGHTVWQVERDEYCLRVLAKHWPEAVRHTDVRAAGASTLAPVDLICGGFPCQDVSSAGARAGLAGERSGLWFDFARVVGEMRPEWVVVENVASGARLWLDQVMAGLAELGYDALPLPLSAADCGAPHLRRRVFVVGRLAADANRDGKHAGTEHAEVAGAPTPPDADGERSHTGKSGAGPERPGWAEPWGGVWSRDAPEPCLRRVDDGAPARVVGRAARLRALGNAVVPQCAEVVGWVIREIDAESLLPPGRGRGE